MAFDIAAERLSLFNDRFPELYNGNNNNVETTERAIRSELVDLEPYHDDIETFESRFQMHGFLRYHSYI